MKVWCGRCVNMYGKRGKGLMEEYLYGLEC